MKKIISLLIAVLTLATTVFAGYEDELSSLWEKSTDLSAYSGEVTMSAKLNQPLDIIDTIPVDEDLPVDIKMLTEDALKSIMKVDYSYSASKDMKKVDMALSAAFDAPITLNEDFKLDAYAKVGMWVTYDFTDSENPAFKVIFKTPFSTRYQVIDAAADLGFDSAVASVTDKERIKESNKKILKALLQNADIKKNGNEYIIKLDDDGAKKYILDVLSVSKEYVDINSEAYTETYMTLEEAISFLEEFFQKTTILGEDGFALKLTKNAGGNIIAQVQQMHIKFNVYDILKAYGKTTEGLDRESAVVDVTFNAEATIANHDKAKAIIPELTEENSKKMHYGYNYSTQLVGKEEPIFENNYIYFPIEEIAKAAGKEVDITQEADKITVDYSTGESVEVRGNITVFNGKEVEHDVPQVIIKDGKAYCTEDMLYPLGVEMWNTSYDVESDRFIFTFELVEKPEIDEDAEFVKEESYIPFTLYYNFSIEAPAYVKNKICYMPANAFMQALFAGEAVESETELTYTAEEENVFGIDTFYVKAGDDFALINGEKKTLGGIAEMVDGILNIPTGFAKDLGMECRVNINYSIYSDELEWTTYSNFHFEMDNPEFTPMEDDDEDYEYVSPTLYCYVRSDQVPHRENGEIYVPVYDLLLSMTAGDFTYDEEDDLKFVASKENDYGIENVTVNIGDKFVTINDEKVEFKNSVVEVNDIIRVPIEFTQKLGFETNSISAGDSYSRYSFEMDNPEYNAHQEEKDEDNEYSNWFYQLFE